MPLRGFDGWFHFTGEELKKILLIAAALSLAACDDKAPEKAAAGKPAASTAGQVLNVYNWPDYVAPDTISNFEKQYDVVVRYDVFSGNDVLEQKLRDKAVAYDVVFPSARPYAADQIKQGLLRTLDKSALGNWKNLSADALQGLSALDAGNAHLVPYMWGTTGLGINVDKVGGILGHGADLATWGTLFNPVNAARLSDCGIGVVDDDEEGHTAALIWLGRDANDLSASNLGAVQDAFAKIRPYIRKFGNATELIDDLASGKLCMILSYSGDVAQAQSRAEELAQGGEAPEIRYLIPREGALRWMDVVAIPKDSTNPKLAHQFINYLLEPEVMSGITNHVAYANANTASTPLIDKEISGDPGIYPPAAVAARLVDSADFSEEQRRQRKDSWNKIVYSLMR